MKCKECGSRKAGQDHICWRCNPKDRRYKYGLHSPLWDVERDKGSIPKKVLAKLLSYFKKGEG